MRVRILGAGVAGLACAIAMRDRCGFDDVVVYERGSPDATAGRPGHGLILMQNGVAAVRELNADGFLRRYRALDRAVFQDGSGRVLRSEGMDGVYCVTRAGLVEALRAALPPGTVEYGRRCTGVELTPTLGPGRDPRTVRRHVRGVRFDSGPRLTDDDADLFVGADGYRSPLSDALNPGLARPLSPVCEIVTSTWAPELAAELGSTFLKTTFAGRGLAFGLLAPTSDRVIGFLQFDSARYGLPEQTHGSGLGAFVARLLNDAPEPVATYLRLADYDTAHLWRPVNGDVARGLCGSNAVVVGDAAHPLLPFTSQGVAAALEDAVMLADAIAPVANELALVPRALAGFAHDRTNDLAAFVAGGRRILSHFVGDSEEWVAPYVPGGVSKLEEHLSLPSTDARSLFGLFDGDGDGFLTRAEFRQAVALMAGDTVAPDGRNALFGELDRSGDGLIAISHLVVALGAGGPASRELWQLRRQLTPRRMSICARKCTAADPLFADASVDVATLRRRAFNHRWAVQPPDVIPLTAADSDFPVCAEIVTAIQRYTSAGYLPYAPPEGLPEFRHAAAEALRDKHGLSCGPELVLPTDGAASALFLIAQLAIAAPGDEAIIPDPVDFLLERSVRAAGGVVKRSQGLARGVDIGELESLVTPRTRVISICNPHNPLGRVLRRDELEQVADFAARHNLWILSDEVWSDIVYAPHRHIPMATLGREVAARTFTVFGFSKSYGLAGLRLGMIVAPGADVRARLLQIAHAGDTAYGVSAVSQVAGTAACEAAGGWLERFVAHLRSQRDYAVARLRAMPGVTCEAPEGTFVAFPDVSRLGAGHDQVADHLLREHRLAVVPGSEAFFGPGAAGHLRLSFATSRGILADGLDRFERGVRSLSASDRAPITSAWSG